MLARVLTGSSILILVIDTETTGIDPFTDKVVELAGVGLTGGVWSGLVSPGGPIPPEASAVHHLTEASFSGEGVWPDLTAAWVDMLRHCKTMPEAYAAHNSTFDRGFIARLGYGGSAPWLCTWRCALHLWPDAPAYGNQVLRYYLGLKPGLPPGLAPHRALYDAIVTSELLKEMLKLKTLTELLELQHKPVLLKTVRFGKHAGKLWNDVPREYLRWMLSQDFDGDILHTAKHYFDEKS